MNTSQLLFVALIFVMVAGVAAFLFTRVEAGRAQKRLLAVGGHSAYGQSGKRPGWLEAAVALSGPFARLSLPEEGWENSPLRLRFMNAGHRGDSAVMLYFAAKTVLAVGLPAVVFVALSLAGSSLEGSVLMLILLSLAAFGYYLPNVVLSRMVMYRQREIFENFPDAADLMLVCVESGLGLDAGLSKVAEEMRMKSEALAEELQLVNLEMRAGSTREKALRNLALRTGVEEVNTFATMLVQADRFGTSVGESLRVFSDEMRTRRKFRAEEMAVKIPLKLLLPLIFCIFPSLLLVLLGPAFIQVYRILLPTMAGGQ